MFPLGEIRKNPFTGDHIIVNEKRLSRPIITNKKSLECPFCPTSRERHPNLPDRFDAIAFENRFPALQLSSLNSKPLNWNFFDSALFEKAPNWGKCEVVLYSDHHELDFHQMPLEKAIKVTKLWQQRFSDLSRNSMLKYIFIFENHGKDVGVTIFHPHGQIYALPFIPTRISTMITNCQKHLLNTGNCLQCDLLHQELTEKTRIINENRDFVALAPFYSTLPHEIHVVPKRHVPDLTALNEDELTSFTLILQDIRKRYDLLFQKKEIPNYMMMFFSKPVNINKEIGTVDEIWHFRVEFLSLDRDDHNLKYRAAVESGLNVWTNDVSPETVAKKMRTLRMS